MPRPIAIVCTGSTFAEIQASHGDFCHWIAQGLGTDTPTSTLDATTIAHADDLPPASAFAGVVLTGSHAMVSAQAPWSEALAAWLRAAVQREVPVLGICYGHQLLAHALGGVVDYHPQGLEIGTHPITAHPAAACDALLGPLVRPMFAALMAPLLAAQPQRSLSAMAPPAPTFAAQLVHAQSVRLLPAGAQVLASTAHEPHQAFRVGPCAWGVQFHPEFSPDAMRAYFAHVPRPHTHSPAQWAALAASVQPTPEAASLLARFAHIAHGGDAGL